ncbi:PspA/IM30 family protein [Mycobacterium gastri]|uniref:35 kDa protein n=1 Tax=Mycobacterium gastri TaxID=1777 RepID=A0A1X1VY46_MYCGS|nr:hypothetical protein [Mycobacterium gastri]ETW23444.1 hypothetical protein MGAST_14045 [Mycobacterium gastri 'Wayne']ORV74800.1 hypothetical protein AWC07_24650 [Mycobacterium gastri]
MPDEPRAPIPDSADAGSDAGYDPGYDAGYDDSGVPTFESVREKIESRYAAALGAAELDAETSEGRSVEEQYEKRQRAAAERLAQIRESMHTDQ